VRLFVAVRIDPHVGRTIATFSEGLRKQVEQDAPSARITWVKEDQLHITIRFVGHVDDAQGIRIQDALKPPVDVQPFEVRVAGAGAFPVRGAPRVLWVGITEGLESLAALELDTSARLSGCGIEREDRPYSPHITLARVREPAGLRARALFQNVSAQPFGAWRVDAITLFESRPSTRGHEYVPLQSTNLRWKSS
jgi:2'-5' RNA ligase